MAFIILLSVFSLISAQKKIVIFHNGTKSNLADFEKELILYTSNLYLQKTKATSEIKLVPIIDLSRHLKELAGLNHNNETLYLSINILSKTEEREKKYDLTAAYMPNVYCILGRPENSSSGKICGYIKGTTHETILPYARDVGDNLNFKAYTTFTDRMKDFENGTIDYILSEYVDIWNYKLKLVHLLDNAPRDKFVVLLVKNNPYNSVFIDTFDYYVKSQAYYKLIRKHFGNTAVNYFTKNNKK